MLDTAIIQIEQNGALGGALLHAFFKVNPESIFLAFSWLFWGPGLCFLRQHTYYRKISWKAFLKDAPGQAAAVKATRDRKLAAK